MTVVWSRPPKCSPIVFNEFFVNAASDPAVGTTKPRVPELWTMDPRVALLGDRRRCSLDPQAKFDVVGAGVPPALARSAPIGVP